MLPHSYSTSGSPLTHSDSLDSDLPGLSPSTSSPQSSPTPPPPPPVFLPIPLPGGKRRIPDQQSEEEQQAKKLKRAFSATRPSDWPREVESTRQGQKQVIAPFELTNSESGAFALLDNGFVPVGADDPMPWSSRELDLHEELMEARALLKAHHDSLDSPTSQLGPSPPSSIEELILSVTKLCPQLGDCWHWISIINEEAKGARRMESEDSGTVGLTTWPAGSRVVFEELDRQGCLTPEVLTLFSSLPVACIKFSATYRSSDLAHFLPSACSIISHPITYPTLTALDLNSIPLPLPLVLPESLVALGLNNTGLTFPHLTALLQRRTLSTTLLLLGLGGNEMIGDDALMIVKWLRSLKTVDLRGTAVSIEGLREYICADRVNRGGRSEEGLRSVIPPDGAKDWIATLRPLSYYFSKPLDETPTSTPSSTPNLAFAPLPPLLSSSSPVPGPSSSTPSTPTRTPANIRPKGERKNKCLSASVADPVNFIRGLTKVEINLNLFMLELDSKKNPTGESVGERRIKLEKGWRRRVDEDLCLKVLSGK